jgi:hypothetical protein
MYSTACQLVLNNQSVNWFVGTRTMTSGHDFQQSTSLKIEKIVKFDKKEEARLCRRKRQVG